MLLTERKDAPDPVYSDKLSWGGTFVGGISHQSVRSPCGRVCPIVHEIVFSDPEHELLERLVRGGRCDAFGEIDPIFVPSVSEWTVASP
jgi:hypothetical protein